MTKSDKKTAIPSSPYYLVDLNGNLRFTSYGKAEFEEYFYLAGINIRHIHTYQSYLNARKAASPYFLEWLRNRSGQWPDTEQFNLLRHALFGLEGH